MTEFIRVTPDFAVAPQLTAEDIARVVTFLCSEEAGWIVGQTIVADGGHSLMAS